MDTKATGWQKLTAALRRRRTGWQSPGGGPRPDSGEPPTAESVTPPRLAPLDRIREYLRRRGLAQEVQVRPETTGTGFILEDADGLVHAKDYDTAVRLIERIWLYRR